MFPLHLYNVTRPQRTALRASSNSHYLLYQLINHMISLLLLNLVLFCEILCLLPNHSKYFKMDSRHINFSIFNSVLLNRSFMKFNDCSSLLGCVKYNLIWLIECFISQHRCIITRNQMFTIIVSSYQKENTEIVSSKYILL